MAKLSIHVDKGLVIAQGLQGKYCGMCSYYERVDRDVSEPCLKNKDGSSKAMEADILVALLADGSAHEQEGPDEKKGLTWTQEDKERKAGQALYE
jgi:hypothetical protein